MSNFLRLFFALAIISTIFSSCAKDDDSTLNENPFMGTWKLVSLTVEHETTSVIENELIVSTNYTTGSSMDYKLIFTEESFTTVGNYDLDIIVTSNGTNQVINTSMTDVEGAGTYSYDDFSISISNSFFSADAAGVGSATFSQGPVDANYIIESGELIFDSIDNQTTEQNGVTTTVMGTSQSRWIKQ